MTSRPDLAVLLYERHVANLVDAGFGDAAIRYNQTANADPAGCRLSLSLPVQAEIHPAAGPGGRWVRSLLPEGRALAWATQNFGIPEDDRYALIAALGADVAGAVRILESPDAAAKPGSYAPLSQEDLAQLVKRAPEMGLGLDRSKGVRLSLAGTQDKVLLHRIGNGYYQPIGGAPSSLIVKPEPPVREGGLDLSGLATNELLCLILAGQCGLRAAEATVEVFGSIPSLVVTRFDRVEVGDHLSRLHQEDLLGAMGIDPLLKYEQPMVERRAPAGGFADNGTRFARPGPSLFDMARLLTDHMGSVNVLHFLEAVTFNIMIGNADSHARNYSLLLHRTGDPEFAPLYDLISTRIYPQLDADAPQRVNGKTQIDDIRTEDIVQEAIKWGLPESVSRVRIHRTIERLADHVEGSRRLCVQRGGDPNVAAAVKNFIVDRLESFRP